MPTRAKQSGRDDGAAPAERLLDAATALFDREGIRAVGIDRLIMLLTNTQTIRDVILFPLLRPEKNASQPEV